jgi:hypothetical protein
MDRRISGYYAGETDMAVHGQERRRHKRLKLECPVSFFTRGGKVVTKGRSLDISDGGTFVSVPVEAIDKIQGRLNLTFSIPRSTENTYMLEDFASQANVLRRQPLVDENLAGVAMTFANPIHLALEV